MIFFRDSVGFCLKKFGTKSKIVGHRRSLAKTLFFRDVFSFVSIDFGTIGCVCLNNVVIAPVFDQKFLERRFQSKEKKALVSKLKFRRHFFESTFFYFLRGQHFDKYLKKIVRNVDPVDWKSIDLKYLIKVKRKSFDKRFSSFV